MKGLSCLKSGKWWNFAGTRALKTCCQTGVALVGVNLVMQQVDWVYVASAVALATILSLGTSLGGIPEADDPTAGKEGTD